MPEGILGLACIALFCIATLFTWYTNGQPGQRIADWLSGKDKDKK